MKYFIGGIILAMALICTAEPAFAVDEGGNSKPSQEAQLPPPAMPTCAVTLIGTIQSIDKNNNAVVVKDQNDKMDKTIYLNPDAIKNLKAGQTVSFQLSAPAKTENVKILKREKSK
jgi:hypothetical protein